MTEKKYKKTITKILKIRDKILKKTISLPKTNFVYSFLIPEIILMNLEIENLIFKKNYDPTGDTIKILENLDYKIGIIKKNNIHSDKKKIEKQNFIKENLIKSFFKNFGPIILLKNMSQIELEDIEKELKSII